MNFKNDFKILNTDLVYLDSGATSLTPNSVIEKMNDYYNNYNSNIHRGDYKISLKASDEYESVRTLVKEFINARSNKEIVFTSGVTESLNMIIYGYFMNHLKENDEVLITKGEHASNIIPWFDLENKIGIKVKYIPLNNDYTFNIDNLINSITDNTKVISISEITNVIGDVRNVKEITKICHERGIKVVIDAAQSAGHKKIDVIDTDVDFLGFSAHKMLGPTGVGVLYGKEDLLNEIDYFKKGGGTTISFDDPSKIVYKELPYKLEAGTPNIAGVIGLGEAIRYINNIGIDNIEKHICDLKKYLISKVGNMPNLIIYNKDVIGSTFIFNVKNVFAQDTAIYLDKHNIAVRAGDHCDKKLKDEINISNTVRVSLYFYNTREDIDKLVDALKNNNILEESIGF